VEDVEEEEGKEEEHEEEEGNEEGEEKEERKEEEEEEEEQQQQEEEIQFRSSACCQQPPYQELRDGARGVAERRAGHEGTPVHYEQTVRQRFYRCTMSKQSDSGCNGAL